MRRQNLEAPQALPIPSKMSFKYAASNYSSSLQPRSTATTLQATPILGRASICISDMEDDDSEDDFGTSDNEILFEDYEDPLKGGLKSLNMIVKAYTNNWEAGHGWRELYQNWVDAIKESNNLGSKSFTISTQHCKNFLCWMAVHPETKLDLGFVRFSKRKGAVDITNYNAFLSGETFALGSTSKRGKENLAGHHGEGYKIAALTLLRKGYNVKIRASSCIMKFEVGKSGKKHAGELCVRIDRAKPKPLAKQQNEAQQRKLKGLPRLLKGNIWEDVSFQISGRKPKLDWETELEVETKVEEEEFMKWTKLCLQLDPPTEVITTQNGCIILDPRFFNKVFLKGILLEDSSSTANKFHFGYNLLRGEVDRDRQRLSSPKQQAILLAGIWSEAMEKDSSVVAKYVNLLQLDPAPADVELSENNINESTAKKIWEHLRAQDPQDELFYYDIRGGEQDGELIRKSLKKKPAPLSKPIWVALRHWKLVHTPQEERHHLLHTAPPATDRATLFSASVERALKAALTLDPRTKGLNLIFKSGVSTDLDLLLFESTLEINDKWLSFLESHQRSPCWLSRGAGAPLPEIDHFTCSHVVIDLYELILDELGRHPEPLPNLLTESKKSLHQQVCESILKMPVMVKAVPGDHTGEIEVRWNDSECDILSRVYGFDPQCRVILHHEGGCSAKRSKLLAEDTSDVALDQDPLAGDEFTVLNGDHRVSGKCDCQEQVVSRKHFKAIFEGLDPEENYFPMVSRTDSQAFFGYPPKSVRPKVWDRIIPTRSAVLENKSTPRFGTSNSNYRPPSAYDEEDEDDFVEIGQDNHSDIYEASPAPRVRRQPRSESSGSRFDTPAPTASKYQSGPPPVNRTLRSEINHNNEELAAKNAEIERLKAEVDKLSTQLIDKEQLLGTLKGKCETQQKSIDESNRKRQSMIKTHQEQVEAKDQQISEALRSNEVLQWKHKTDLEDLQAKTSIGAHKKNIRDIEKLLRAAEADVRKATEEFKSKELQLAEAQATIQSLQSSLDTANTDLQVKQRKLATESARFEALQTSRDALSADLEAKKKEIDASKAEIEKFRDMDQDANGTIDGLRIQIQRLTEERDILASDLKQAEDNLDAHKRLDSQTLERRNRVLTGGVKRERDELQNDGESDRALKRTRIVPVITIKQEGAIDLTGDDDNVPAQSLNV